jgi:uncharacterized protein YndB with AHSA1/START domain
MSTQVHELVVRKSITIDAPAAHVFTVFSEHFDAWWPRKQHIGRTEKFSAILEPRVGGRWYEKSDDGSECDWGRVLAWQPPKYILLSWNINDQWRYDPNFVTEVEVRFVAETPQRTRVELEHRKLEHFGDQAAKMRALFDSPEGWAGTLQAMAREAQRRYSGKSKV